MNAERTEVVREQLVYARWLSVGVALGFAALAASFLVYMLGLLPPSVAPTDLPRYWSLPVREYVAATGAPTGWQWVHRLGQGDLLNFAGVAVLGATTIACMLRMALLYARSRRRMLAAICAAQAAVLVLAAWGILG